MVSMDSLGDGQVEVTASSVAQDVDNLCRRGLISQAEEVARKALDRFGHSSHGGDEFLISINAVLGCAYLNTHQYQKALDSLGEADKLPGADVRVSCLLMVARAAVQGCDEIDVWAAGLVERYPGHAAEVHYFQGHIYLKHERPVQAAVCFETVLKLDESHRGALVGLTFACLDAGSADEAALHAAAVAGHEPASVEDRMAVACSKAENGEYEQAAATAQEILRVAPGDTHVVVRCIEILRRAYKLPEAVAAANQALKQHIDHPWKVHAVLACVLIDLGKYDAGAHHAREALKGEAGRPASPDPLAPEAVVHCVSALRRAYQFGEAECAATEALKREVGDPWKIHTALAWVYSDMGRYDEAISQIDKAVTQDVAPRGSGGFRWAVRSRIDILREAHRFEDAQKAAEEAPDHPDIRIALAWVLSDQDLEAEAATKAAEVLKCHPAHAAAMTARIYFLRWARNWTEAMRAAHYALGKRPHDPDVLTAVGWLLSDLSQPSTDLKRALKDPATPLSSCLDDPNAALTFADRALGTDAFNSWALSSKISFYSAAGRYREAGEAVEEALGQRPGDDPRLHVAAGWLYGDQDDYDRALDHFGAALKRNPHEAEALTWSVATQRARLTLKQAKIQARHGIERRPGDPGMHLEQGKVHDDQREFKGALGDFEKVLSADADNVAARIARSATLRAQHREDTAELEIEAVARRRQGNQDLQTELGWIYYDQRLFDKAQRCFGHLIDQATNDRERAAAHYGKGWAQLEAGHPDVAEDSFTKAVAARPGDANYQLALAWALTRQVDEQRRDADEQRLKAAEEMARSVAKRRNDPFAETCLGVIACKRGRLAEAERQFRKALELDPYGGRTDLGALYVRMGRYDEAEAELTRALQRDPRDIDAQLYLGYLYLQPAYENLPAAERAFRKALAGQPGLVEAVVGQAQVLTATGRDIEAESLLRSAIRQQQTAGRWRTHLALARLLVRQGSEQQDPDQLTEALRQVETATAQSHGERADLSFVAGAAGFHLASVSAGNLQRYAAQRRSRHHLEQCLKRDPDHVEARRYLGVLKRAMVPVRLSIAAVYLTAAVTLSLLVMEWLLFAVFHKIGPGVISTNTPILAGLFMVSFLLPTLIHIKMPGFEAEMQPNREAMPPGPNGDDMLGPGRFTVVSGPTGQIPRHGADIPHPKSWQQPYAAPGQW